MHLRVHKPTPDVYKRQVLKDGGVAIMSTGYGAGDNRVSEAIKNAQHSPLLNNNDIFNSSLSSMAIPNLVSKSRLKRFMNSFTSSISLIISLYCAL